MREFSLPASLAIPPWAGQCKRPVREATNRLPDPARHPRKHAVGLPTLPPSLTDPDRKESPCVTRSGRRDHPRTATGPARGAIWYPYRCGHREAYRYGRRYPYRLATDHTPHRTVVRRLCGWLVRHAQSG